MDQQLIHAHDLFDLIESFQGGISQEDLRRVTSERFGAARFTNCEGMEFEFEEFLVFARERKKIVEQNGKLVLQRSKICSGDHEH